MAAEFGTLSNTKEPSYRLMSWMLINGLFGAGRRRGRDAIISRRDQGFAIQPSSGDSGGKAAGSSLEDLVRRAEKLAKAGQLNAALECYGACVQDYPHGLDAYLGIANVLVDLWSSKEAVASYGKALELAPLSSTIYSA